MNNKVEIILKGNEFKRVLDSYFDTIKKRYFLKKVDIEVLLYLSECEEKNTPTDIHTELGLNRGHVSQAIDTLTKKGFIQSFPDTEDRRVVHYLITDSAIMVRDEISTLKKDFEQKLFKDISESEREVYKKITLKIMDNLRRM